MSYEVQLLIFLGNVGLYGYTLQFLQGFCVTSVLIFRVRVPLTIGHCWKGLATEQTKKTSVKVHGVRECAMRRGARAREWLGKSVVTLNIPKRTVLRTIHTQNDHAYIQIKRE